MIKGKIKVAPSCCWSRSFHGKINQMFQMLTAWRLTQSSRVFSSLCPPQFVWLLLWRQPRKATPLPLNSLKTQRSPYFHCLPPLPLQEHSSLGAFGPSVDTFMVCHEISRRSQLSLWTSVAQPPGTAQQINDPPCRRPHLRSIRLFESQKHRERNPCLSNITFALTQTFPNSSSSSLLLAVRCIFTVSSIYCNTVVTSVSDSQAYTCGCIEASEGYLGDWRWPN